MNDPVERAVETQVEQLGFELVELERAGSKSRPILRLRIDRPAAAAGEGIGVEDCRTVSRAVETLLEERGDVPQRYVLEVSSPGIERPLVRGRDFERFRGREIVVLGREALHAGSSRVEGELEGLEDAGGQERIILRLRSGETLRIPRERTKKVHLVYRWGGAGRDS